MGKFKCLHCKSEFDTSGVILDENGNEFCCNGCKNVFAFLSSNGLDEFYDRLGKQTHIKAKKVEEFKDESSKSFYKNYVKNSNGFCEIILS